MNIDLYTTSPPICIHRDTEVRYKKREIYDRPVLMKKV